MGLHFMKIDEPLEDLFTCPKCACRYRAMFEIYISIKQGSFNCQECDTLVHCWRGVRDYHHWEKV